MNGLGYRSVVLCCVIAVAPAARRAGRARRRPAAARCGQAACAERGVGATARDLRRQARRHALQHRPRSGRGLAGPGGLEPALGPDQLSVGQSLVVRRPGSAAEGPVTVSPVAPSQPIAVRPLGADAPSGAAAPAGEPAAAGRSAQDRTQGGAPTLFGREPRGVAAERRRRAPRRRRSRRRRRPCPPAPKPEPRRSRRSSRRRPPSPSRTAPTSGRLELADRGPGRRQFHGAGNKGLDIVGQIGDPVYASACGRVVFSGTAPGYGKLVIIKHNETYLSAYAHNSNVLVKEGQNVVRGRRSPRSVRAAPQAKLHFEIRRLGKPVDPLKFLPTARTDGRARSSSDPPTTRATRADRCRSPARIRCRRRSPRRDGRAGRRGRARRIAAEPEDDGPAADVTRLYLHQIGLNRLFTPEEELRSHGAPRAGISPRARR